MRVVTAPEKYTRQEKDVFVFLAGGITNCSQWQKEVIKELSGNEFEHLVLFNPRRDNFPIDEGLFESWKQIEWEFDAIKNCDIFLFGSTVVSQISRFACTN